MLLFDRTEKLICTLNNEKRPIENDFHDDNLNGENTFEFTIPADIEYADQVKVGHYVAFQDRDGHFQMFEIMEVIDNKSDKFKKTVYCENIMVELNDEPIKDKRPTNTTAEFALGQVLDGTRWQVGTVDNLGNKSTNFYDTNSMKALGRILEVWGGEVRARVEMSGKNITGRYIDILERRGNITGKRITNTKDIETIERTVDITRIKTAMIGRGMGEELETGGFGRRINFADINGGLDYVTDEDARILWGRINPDNSRKHLFGYFEDPQETDPAILKTKTEEALAKVVNPLVAYKIEFFDMEAVGLNHEKVRQGDTVEVVDDDFNPPLELTARVIRLKRSITDPAKGFVVLGNFLPSLTDDQRLERIEASFNQKTGIWDQSSPEFTGPVPTNWLDGEIDTLTNQLKASGDFQSTEPIEGIGLLFENNDVMAVSHGAIYMGPNTLAIASERDPVTSEWNWRSWGSGQGFTADVLTAGTLQGGKVKFNLEAGTFLIGDSYEDYKMYFDGTNFKMDLSNEGSQITTIVRGSEEYTQDLAQVDRDARAYAEEEANSHALKMLGATTHELAIGLKMDPDEGSYYTSVAGLRFNILSDIHIGQVTVYADGDGEIEISLIHHTKTYESRRFSVKEGPNKLFLNYYLDSNLGKTWRLLGTPIQVGIFRTVSAHTIFPYLSGSFEIDNSNTGNNFYYFFYDLEIAGIGVEGERTTRLITMESQISQNHESVELSFTEFTQRIDDIDEYIVGDENTDGLKTYFNFSTDGLVVGNTRASDPFIMRITNNELSFEDAGNKVAWINTSQLFITDAKIVKSIHIGAHLIESRGTGTNQMTVIKWIGGVAG